MYQPVMVPEDLIGDVYAFLSERMTQDTPSTTTEEAVRSWTALDGKQVERRTNEPVIRLMDMCVEAHPEPVSTSEFVDRTGIPMANLRSGLGGLTRTLKAYLPGLPYPIESDWGPNMGKESAEQYYWLSDEFARVWREIRSAE